MSGRCQSGPTAATRGAVANVSSFGWIYIIPHNPNAFGGANHGPSVKLLTATGEVGTEVRRRARRRTNEHREPFRTGIISATPGRRQNKGRRRARTAGKTFALHGSRHAEQLILAQSRRALPHRPDGDKIQAGGFASVLELVPVTWAYLADPTANPAVVQVEGQMSPNPAKDRMPSGYNSIAFRQ